MATGRVQDDRTIHRAIRLPGKRVVKTDVERGERKVKSLKDGKVEVHQAGGVITDPDTLQQSGLDLTLLREQGIISGNW